MGSSINNLESTSGFSVRTVTDLVLPIRVWKNIYSNAGKYFFIKYDDFEKKITAQGSIKDICIKYIFNEAKIAELLHHSKSAEDQATLSAYQKTNEELFEKLFLRKEAAGLAEVKNYLLLSASAKSPVSKEINTLVQANWELLKTSGAFDAITDKSDIDKAGKADGVQIRDFMRYLFLQRRFIYFSRIESLLNKFCFDTAHPQDFIEKVESGAHFPKLKKLLSETTDYAFWYAEETFAAIQGKRSVTHPHSLGDSHISRDELREFRTAAGEAKKEFDNYIAEIKAGKIPGDFYMKYEELSAKKEASSFLVKEKEQQLSLTDTVTDTIAKEASTIEKRITSKELYLQAAKQAASTAGVRFGKALYYELFSDEEVQWDVVAKECALELMEAGIGLVAGAFLGSLGGTVTSSVMSLFKPHPEDPYLVQFERMDKKLDTIITKIDAVKDYLSLEIEKSEYRKALLEFRQDFTHISTVVSQVNTTLKEAYSKQMSTDDETLSILRRQSEEVDARIITALSTFCKAAKAIYHPDDSTDLALREGLAFDFIDFHVMRGTSFFKTYKDLNTVINTIEQCMIAYLSIIRTRRQVLFVAVAFNPGEKAEKYLQDIEALTTQTETYSTRVTATIMFLKEAVLGSNHTRLYNLVMHKKINWDSGFYFGSPANAVNGVIAKDKWYYFDFKPEKDNAREGTVRETSGYLERFRFFAVGTLEADLITLMNYHFADEDREFTASLAMDRNDQLVFAPVRNTPLQVKAFFPENYDGNEYELIKDAADPTGKSMIRQLKGHYDPDLESQVHTGFHKVNLLQTVGGNQMCYAINGDRNLSRNTVLEVYHDNSENGLRVKRPGYTDVLSKTTLYLINTNSYMDYQLKTDKDGLPAVDITLKGYLSHKSAGYSLHTQSYASGPAHRRLLKQPVTEGNKTNNFLHPVLKPFSAQKHSLAPYEFLEENDCLISPDRKVHLKLENDGLRLFDRHTGTVLWHVDLKDYSAEAGHFIDQQVKASALKSTEEFGILIESLRLHNCRLLMAPDGNLQLISKFMFVENRVSGLKYGEQEYKLWDITRYKNVKPVAGSFFILQGESIFTVSDAYGAVIWDQTKKQISPPKLQAMGTKKSKLV